MRLPILLIVFVCLLTRLPPLISPNLMLDGDECILALMAKHLLEGKEVSIFFWGQSYGFSLLETLVIAIGYLLFGVNQLAVKLAMLSIWIGGVVFMYRAMLGFCSDNRRSAIWMTLIFVFLPSWTVWSMKARGGYLTAFFLSSLLIFMLTERRCKNYVTYFASGIATGFIIVAQPIWFIGLLPLLCFHRVFDRKLMNFCAMLAGAEIAILIFYFAAEGNTPVWFPIVFGSSLGSFADPVEYLRFVYANVTGSYYLDHVLQSPQVVTAFAALFSAMVFVLPILAGILLVRKISISPYFYIFTLSVLLTLAYPFFLNQHAPRYLLPLSGWVVLSWFFLLNRFHDPRKLLLPLCGVLILEIAAVISFKDFRFDGGDPQTLVKLVNDLSERKINYVFAEGGLLQWQIIFYSGEKIFARYISPLDRYPDYGIEVNRAFSKGERTALVGFSNLVPEGHASTLFNQRYYTVVDPSPAVLLAKGFRF